MQNASWQFGVGALLVLAAACSGAGDASGGERGEHVRKPVAHTPDDPTPLPSEFESDLPNGDLSGGAPSGAPSAGQPSDGNAGRAIAEADVIQVKGDRLFALSQLSGLSIVDVSDPTRLKLLGRYRDLPGQPFEMFLRDDDVAVLLFKSWMPAFVAAGERPTITSQVVVLDVATSDTPRRLATHDLQGMVDNAWIAGDVLYAVSDATAYCSSCAKRETSITSFSLRDPSSLDEVASVRVAREQDQALSSVAFSAQRAYVASSRSNNEGADGATITVVDVSDRGGALERGVELQVPGHITSAGQMDEHEGVLRVVSQPEDWQGGRPAHVQTFRIVSSKQIDPLGEVQIPVAEGEQLANAHFDGTRGHIVGNQLYSVDLSTPAEPKLGAAVDLTGDTFYLESHGDRLFAYGTAERNKASGLAVSMFDVQNLAAPKLLSRVEFGGRTAGRPDPQTGRAQFSVVSDAGLIVVPYAGNDFGESGTCNGRPASAVQLIDFDRDQLSARTAAAVEDAPRRAIVHRGHLIAIGDRRIEVFSITDRAAPVLRAALWVSSNITRVAHLEHGTSVRMHQPGLGSHYTLEFVADGDVQDLNKRLGAVVFPDFFSTDPEVLCGLQFDVQDIHADGSRLYVVYEVFYDTNELGAHEHGYGVLTLDATDPRAPQLIGKTEWSQAFERDWGPYSDYSRHSSLTQSSFVWNGSTLALIEQDYRVEASTGRRLHLIDLSDPAAPNTHFLPLAEGDAYVGLSIVDATIFVSRYHELASGRIKHYVDRIDISEPRAPSAQPSVNTPGALLSYDAVSGRAITLAYRRAQIAGARDADCFAHFGGLVDARATSSGCAGYVPILQLTELGRAAAHLEDTLPLPEGTQVRASAAGAGVVFVTVGAGGFFGVVPPTADCVGSCGLSKSDPQAAQLLVLTELARGSLTSREVQLGNSGNSWWGLHETPRVVARGQRALLYNSNDLAVVDATGAEPRVDRAQHLTPGFVTDVAVQADSALLGLGFGGAQWFPM